MRNHYIKARMTTIRDDVYLVVKETGKIGYTTKLEKATAFTPNELRMCYHTVTRKFAEQHPKTVNADMFYVCEMDQNDKIKRLTQLIKV